MSALLEGPTRRALLTGLLSGALFLVSTPMPQADSTPASGSGPSAMGNLIPLPASLQPAEGTFILSAGADIHVDPGTTEMTAIGQYLADKLNPATGFGMQVTAATGTDRKSVV